MFNRLLAVLLFVLPVTSFANSYYYDPAVFALSHAQKDLDACGVEYKKSVFDQAIHAYESRRFIGYSKGVLKAISQVYGVYNDLDQSNECARAETKKFGALKAAMLDGLMCQ